MKSKLQNKLSQLNEETDLIYQSIESLTEEQLHDTSYGWSIIQVLEHLNIAESGTILYMKKKMQAGDKMPNASTMNSIRLFFAKYFMQSNLRWKAPKVLGSPNGTHSLEEIKNAWKQTRSDLKTYIEEYPEQYLNKAVMKHPLAGRLTLGGAIDASIYHQRHHVHQIKRIRKQINA